MGTVNGSKTLYLKPNANWMKMDTNGNTPWFAVYVFVNDTEYKWVKMEKVGETDVYKAEVPSKYPKVIFCRMKPDSDLNWGNKWNQTSDLIFDATNNCYTVAEETWDKGGGTWSVYKESNI